MITANQRVKAEAIQDAAAQDKAAQIRLVAGPGTGKSFAIEKRVCWLLSKGIVAKKICVVSFTRAASLDLRNRIHGYASEPGFQEIANVKVTTLHSLALRLLRKAGQLDVYPVDPLVLDNWEVENIFDEEFGAAYKIGERRREEIRRDHEALWSTGTFDPINYIPPEPPIKQIEREQFIAFHGPRSRTYACVLPG